MSKVIAAGIFLVRKDKTILICHPTSHKPNFYSIPKGKVEDGEHIFDTAIRETFEETNIDLKNNFNFTIHLLNPVNYKHGKKMLHPFIYIENEDSNIDWDIIEIKCNSNVPIERGGFPEMDGYKWSTIEDARTLLHYTQVSCLDKVLEISEYAKYLKIE